MPYRVFISAAEVSGDRVAAALARELRKLDPSVQVEGFGGEEMRRAGVQIHRETVGRAAMLLHGLGRFPEMWRVLRWTRAYYQKNRPDLHVCVDSSGANLYFAKAARRAGVPVLYYVAPQLWASRPGRIRKVRRYVNQIACILPFEEEYYRQRGVTATYVGHPLFDELPADRRQIVAGRDEAGRFPNAPPVVGLIPGSRRREVQVNMPHMLNVARAIGGRYPRARFVVPTTTSVHDVAVRLARSLPAVECVVDGFDRLLPQCDLCLCKSGTATLHAAAWGVPMIVVYRLNPVVWHLAGRFIVKTPKIALVNILAGNIDLVSEHVPWHGSDEPVAREALQMLDEPERLARQRRNLSQLIDMMDRPGASGNAARIALQMMGAKP